MPRIENVLKLENPEDYICQFHSYRKGHSLLNIELLQKNTETGKLISSYVAFHHVEYFVFTSRLGWRGANFIQESDENCLAMLRYLDINHKSLSLEESKYNLYTLAPHPIERLNDELRTAWKLIASDYYLSDKPA